MRRLPGACSQEAPETAVDTPIGATGPMQAHRFEEVYSAIASNGHGGLDKRRKPAPQHRAVAAGGRSTVTASENSEGGERLSARAPARVQARAPHMASADPEFGGYPRARRLRPLMACRKPSSSPLRCAMLLRQFRRRRRDRTARGAEIRRSVHRPRA